jgi:hypothetical protein
LKLTNKFNLPGAILSAIKNDPYSKGDAHFSVTELLSPPRQRILKMRHAHEIEEDISDRLWSLYGQLMHNLLERANEVDLAEKRFFGEIDGHKISAQIDTLSLKSEVLADYKFQTAYKFKEGQEPDADWVAQLNMQLELLRQNGRDAKALQIVGLIRDFSKGKAKRELNFPKSPIVTVDIPMWSRERTQSFMRARIALHLLAEKELPFCTAEERWADPDVYAVVKGKRAINGGIQFSEETAKKIMAENPGTSIQFRPAVSTRCEDYCSAAPFCTQFQRSKKQNASNPEEESA